MLTILYFISHWRLSAICSALLMIMSSTWSLLFSSMSRTSTSTWDSLGTLFTAPGYTFLDHCNEG